MVERPVVDFEMIEAAMGEFGSHLANVLKRKGSGTFMSRAELRGVIASEMDELIAELEAEGDPKPWAVKWELFDVAAACVFGAACITAGLLYPYPKEED